MKDLTFNLRLDESDRVRLDTLCEYYSVSRAGLVRMLIKRDADIVEARAAARERQAAE